MFSTRGDAHKLYLKLKVTAKNKHSLDELEELTEIEEIRSFYRSLKSSTLEKVYYRVLKEENGMGMIPVLVSSGPWVLLLFSKQLQEFLFKDGNMPFFIFITIYLLILVVSITLHFKEQAWAAIHSSIIKDILHERMESK